MTVSGGGSPKTIQKVIFNAGTGTGTNVMYTCPANTMAILNFLYMTNSSGGYYNPAPNMVGVFQVRSPNPVTGANMDDWLQVNVSAGLATLTSVAGFTPVNGMNLPQRFETIYTTSNGANTIYAQGLILWPGESFCIGNPQNTIGNNARVVATLREFGIAS